MLPYACAPETVFSVSSDGRRPSGEESSSVQISLLSAFVFFAPPEASLVGDLEAYCCGGRFTETRLKPIS